MTAGAPVGSVALAGLSNGSCQLSLCGEGGRAACQGADNTALIYMLLASAKFSTAAMEPFVFTLHFGFVLKVLITFGIFLLYCAVFMNFSSWVD